jgi:hypothetical protein
MGIANLDAGLLNGYLGNNIIDICAFGFTDATENHCAHFVSHVLQLEFGYKCARNGRCIRVQEIFARCPDVGKFADRPGEACLVFVTKAANVDLKRKTMVNVPKKHIGIFVNGTIWHYSNSRDRVVTQTPEQFVLHYPNQANALFYGTFPAGAKAIPYAPLAGALSGESSAVA